MSVRFLLSVLAAVLFFSFATEAPVSAKPSQNYSASKKKKKKYTKRTSKSKTLRNRTKNSWKKKKNANYKRKWKKATKASLNVVGIKNLRHAKLTSKGRMSVAKNTGKNARRNFGKRVAKKFKGKTILSGQQVEDIIAYLLTLKK